MKGSFSPNNVSKCTADSSWDIIQACCVEILNTPIYIWWWWWYREYCIPTQKKPYIESIYWSITLFLYLQSSYYLSISFYHQESLNVSWLIPIFNGKMRFNISISLSLNKKKYYIRNGCERSEFLRNFSTILSLYSIMVYFSLEI